MTAAGSMLESISTIEFNEVLGGRDRNRDRNSDNDIDNSLLFFFLLLVIIFTGCFDK